MVSRRGDRRPGQALRIGLAITLSAGLAASLPWASLEASNVYRGSDDQGNAIFSDRPMGDGEQVEVPSLSVVPASQIARDIEPGKEIRTAPDTASHMAYSTFEIRSPQNEQTLPSGFAGNLEVYLSIEPTLRDQHRVRLLLNGNGQDTRHSEIFELTDLERGTHTLQAELLGADDRVRQRSAPVTLHVQRASVNLPRNPNNP